MKRNSLFVVLVSSLLVLGMGDSYGLNRVKKKKAKKGEVEMSQSQTPKKSAYERLFAGKKVETAKGLMTLHRMEGKLYLELPVALMNRDFLIASTVSEISDNRFANVGEASKPPMHVAFTMVDSTVNMVSMDNCRYLTNDANIADRLAISMKPPVVERYKIEAYNADSSAVVIDMTNLFLSDKEQLDPFSLYAPAAGGGMAQIDKQFNREKSMITGVKAFEDNVIIKTQLSYMAGSRNPRDPRQGIAKRPFTALMTRSVILLPEEGMRPRLADPRIGIFTHPMVRFDREKGTEPEMYVQRWRLEPKDEDAYRRGELVEPKKPIVFYIDDKFPENWKPYVREGVEIWQKAFEKIGFKNAIIAKDFPKDDPNFDPDDFKYSCVRYCPIPVANAMGMPMTDPRTGEIIKATVYIYHNVVEMLQSWRFIQTAPADADVRCVDMPDDILGDCMSYVIAHEVGHTLSLMHNMSASAAIPVDSLRSPSFTQKYGTTYSIMDYARYNYVAQPGDKERGVKLTPPDLGAYDYYAIKWLYTPILDAKTYKDEEPILSQWISENGADPIYRYGKQQFRLRLDPSSVEEDLGDDAMKAGAYGIKNLKYIMKNLDNWVKGNDPDYNFRQRIYNEMVYQYVRYLNHVMINIGGIYLNERYDGDALPAYTTVPKERQKRAVRFMLDEVKDLSWLNSVKLQRGYPMAGNVSGQLENIIFSGLMSSLDMIAICEAKAGKDAYTREAYLTDLYDYIMKPTVQGRTLTAVQKKLQMNFMDALIQGATLNRKGILGADAIASTRSFVNRIEVPDFVKANSRKDYGDIPENMAGAFSNREYVSLQNAVRGEEYMGYGEPTLRGEGAAINHDCYSLLRKVQTLIERQAKTGSKDTQDFYQLMMFKLNKTFKQ